MREATKTLSDFAISTTAALAEDETVCVGRMDNSCIAIPVLS